MDCQSESDREPGEKDQNFEVIKQPLEIPRTGNFVGNNRLILDTGHGKRVGFWKEGERKWMCDESFLKCCFWDFPSECNISNSNPQFGFGNKGYFQR